MVENNDDERDFDVSNIEVFITMHTLAELVGVAYDTAKWWRYDSDKYYWRPPNDFPKPWGGVIRPGKPGTPSPVFPLSEVLDWLARHRPYDLRIALEFGNVGSTLGRLEEREAERQSSSASRASI